MNSHEASPRGRAGALELRRTTAVRLLEHLRRGVFLETAAAAVGIEAKTPRAWAKLGAREARRREKGLDPDPTLDAFVEFARDFEAALVEAENVSAERVFDSGAFNWKAAAWYLERRAPQRWGLKVSLLVTQELEAFLDALEQRLPADVFAQVLRAANEAAPRGEGGGEADAA